MAWTSGGRDPATGSAARPRPPVRADRSKPHRRTLLALALGVTMLAGAVGCASGDGGGDAAKGASPGSVTPQRGGRLVVAIPQREPEQILRLMVESLTTFADSSPSEDSTWEMKSLVLAVPHEYVMR